MWFVQPLSIIQKSDFLVEEEFPQTNDLLLLHWRLGHLLHAFEICLCKLQLHDQVGCKFCTLHLASSNI